MDKMQIPLQLIYNNLHTVTYNTHKLIYSMCVGVGTKYILCIKCRKRYNDTVSVSRYTYRDKGGADGKSSTFNNCNRRTHFEKRVYKTALLICYFDRFYLKKKPFTKEMKIVRKNGPFSPPPPPPPHPYHQYLLGRY